MKINIQPNILPSPVRAFHPDFCMRFSYFIFSIVIISCGSPKESVQLQYSFQKGDSYNLSTTINQKFEQVFDGDAVKLDQEFGYCYRLDIEDIDADGNAKIAAKVLSVAYKQTGIDGAIEYDSNTPKDDDDLALQVLSRIVGRVCYMKLSPIGSILDITGWDSIIADIVDRIGISDPAEKEEFYQKLKFFFDDETYSRQMTLILNRFPQKLLTEGDSWNTSDILSTPFPLQIENKCTLEALWSDSASISRKSGFASSEEIIPIEDGSLLRIGNLSGKMTGACIVNLSNGLPNHGEYKFQLSGDMIPDTDPLSQDDITLPIDFEMTIFVETSKNHDSDFKAFRDILSE